MIVGLLRTLLVLFLVYYAFKFATKYLLPYFVSSRINKIKREQEYARQNYVKQQQAQEGKVTINKESDRKGSHPDEGEYVDFEEVK